jgi:hypothetical protein
MIGGIWRNSMLQTESGLCRNTIPAALWAIRFTQVLPPSPSL